MNRTLHYLFDPLCGWCYGANALLPYFIQDQHLRLNLIPTGLFSAQGARQMTAEFARYAWENDRRIARITGQIFSERYRQDVLGNIAQPFDSGPATLALTAVHLTEPQAEYQVLKAIQHARYVAAQDITQLSVLAEILGLEGMADAQRLLISQSDTLRHTMASRLGRGRNWLESVNAQGVPTLILEESSGARVIPTSELFAYARENSTVVTKDEKQKG